MIFSALLIGIASFVSNTELSNSPLENITQQKKSEYKKSVTGEYTVADNSLNDTSYIVGAGDKFMVALADNPMVRYYGRVNHNGDLFIPELGIIRINRMHLNDAILKVNDSISAKLRKKVYVSLEEVKTSIVYVRGKIANPGTYFKPGNFRILDMISTANNDTLPPLNTSNFREVKCTNQDTVYFYDIYKYLFKGDQAHNPYIYSGDEIHLSPVTRKVFLTGEVLSMTEWIPILPDEDICSFLDLFALNSSSDSEKIIIQRIDSESGNRIMKTINYKNREPFSLQDQDIISVVRKKNYPNILLATVTGEIARPGTYPIVKNALTAKSIIEQAGGATKYGDLSRAVVIRHNKALNGIAAQEVRPEINSAIAMMNIKKDYSIVYLKDNDIFLEPNDQIFIPKNDYYVYVSGSVKRPGGVPYSPGKNHSYYIKQAGGYQWKADKGNSFVMTIYDNAAVSKEKNKIEPGDIIVVPVSQENKTFSTVVIPIISVISTSLVVLLSAYNSLR